MKITHQTFNIYKYPLITVLIGIFTRDIFAMPWWVPRPTRMVDERGADLKISFYFLGPPQTRVKKR